ncbi:diaminopimelate decarboxylase [Companilactobacillus heilongjiangensis]|uniref:Diaminopimelate decarboxylase n=1 Tax=Companilactobacillus heilongjiangensis TaxID=1074467 RepID=A0A0K2LD77_9LACO|nr:diaminopimelate decarboxylase [Companilactobacillus heilongjiangensis]ALB29256.1 diaminopimelate decarboxylase [Companilactobacillus heilongjiangensis]
MITNDLTSKNGHLMIGGVDSVDLAKKYGTPLYVFDVSQIRSQIRKFKSAFEGAGLKYQVSYASKAFAVKAIYQVMKQEDVHIDVVSGGELHTALAAGFPSEKISFHGNNKSFDELVMAVQNHVGVIMLDNFHEIEMLSRILKTDDEKINVMLRLTPGISAHTHKYDQTGQTDSKFGFDVESGQAKEAMKQVLDDSNMNLLGIHAHIGSQIFGTQGFVMLAQKMIAISKDFQKEFNYWPEVINLGGGFGISYNEDDDPITANEFIKQIADELKQNCDNVPEIWIEPGRSIVGPSGYTLYEIGSRKDIPDLTPYVSVDGGMGDNIRPALYQAKYEAVVANKMDEPIVETAHIAGKYCESGDIMIDQQPLPETVPGDILAVLDTGAYGYSMAMNYNRNPRPAVVFVEDGQDKLVVKRETYQDLTSLDLDY